MWHTAAVASDLPLEFRVKSLTIDGTQHLKVKKIKSVLTIVPPSFWRIWAKSPDAGEEDVADDADRISQLYKTMGYYHVNVRYSFDVEDSTTSRIPTAHVNYTIEEGDPVIIERIDIVSEDPAVSLPLADLLDAIPLQTGVTFEEEVYRTSRKVIRRQLGGSGYPFAQVDEGALINPSTLSATVTYTIDTGMLCYFGETTVTGDTRVLSDKILRRAITYDAGEMYNAFHVDSSQRDLYNLDIFQTAVLQPGTPDPETGVVPMTLELRPKKKQSIKLGVGYGFEDGLRLKTGYTYRNPMGQGGRLYLEAQRTDLLTKSLIGYNQPYFWDSQSALLTETGIVEEFLDSYESRKLFGTVRFTRDISDLYNTTVAYFLEYNDLLDVNITDPEEIEAYREDHTFLTSSVFWELIRDSSDSETDPKTGSIITYSMEVASQLLGSGLTYIKPSLELSKYFELPSETVLACRIRLEAIEDPEQNEDIPIFNRLFLGGAQTVRGYSYQELGPMDPSGTPEGGQSTLLANIELRRPIVGRMSGVLFMDMGMVDEESFQYNNEIRYSLGAGIRFGTPVGPLRLDFGYKLNPQPLPDGMEENRWRIHFDIGHAF
jgi:outer membrane protein assembly complex protein YaeT